MALQLGSDGMIRIIEGISDGHRYVICDHPVEGSIERCGELIDVTERGIKMTMDCGKPENHRLHGIDAIVAGF